MICDQVKIPKSCALGFVSALLSSCKQCYPYHSRIQQLLGFHLELFLSLMASGTVTESKLIGRLSSDAHAFVLFNKWTEHWNRERPLSGCVSWAHIHHVITGYRRNVPFSRGVSLSSKRYDTLMVLLHDHRLVRNETNVTATSSRHRALNFSTNRSTWPAIRRPNAVFIHLLKFVETWRSESFLWVTLRVSLKHHHSWCAR